jgi:hypothetical protein
MKGKNDLTQLRKDLNESSLFTSIDGGWTQDHDVFLMNVDLPKESEYRYLTISVAKPESQKWYAFPITVELHCAEPSTVTGNHFREEASTHVFKGASVNLYSLGVVIGMMNLGIGWTEDTAH